MYLRKPRHEELLMDIVSKLNITENCDLLNFMFLYHC